MDNLLNELRGSIRGPLQKGEWDAIRHFGEQCSQLAGRKRIAALEAESRALRDCYEAERSFRLHSCDACSQVHKTKLCYTATRRFSELGEAQEALAALAQEARCSCYRLAEISSREWAERTPCGPHCDALALEKP